MGLGQSVRQREETIPPGREQSDWKHYLHLTALKNTVRWLPRKHQSEIVLASYFVLFVFIVLLYFPLKMLQQAKLTMLPSFQQEQRVSLFCWWADSYKAVDGIIHRKILSWEKVCPLLRPPP